MAHDTWACVTANCQSCADRNEGPIPIVVETAMPDPQPEPPLLTPEMLADVRQRLAGGRIIVFGHKTVAVLVSALDAAVARADEEGDKVDGLLADRKQLETVLENERGARKVLLDQRDIAISWRQSSETERDLERQARQQAEEQITTTRALYETTLESVYDLDDKLESAEVALACAEAQRERLRLAIWPMFTKAIAVDHTTNRMLISEPTWHAWMVAINDALDFPPAPTPAREAAPADGEGG